MSLLTTEKLVKQYGERRVVNGMSINVADRKSVV